MEQNKKLYRSNTDRMLGGVCGGLGEFFEIDPVIFRLLFIVSAFLGGGIILYLVLWLIIPEPNNSDDPKETVKKNAEEIEKKAKEATNNLVSQDNSKIIWAWLLIILGLVFLLDNLISFNIFELIRLDVFWPVLLVILGIYVIVKKE